MTHAEQYSTSEPSALPLPPGNSLARRVISTVLALATALGIASAVIFVARPASADQICRRQGPGRGHHRQDPGDPGARSSR